TTTWSSVQSWLSTDKLPTPSLNASQPLPPHRQIIFRRLIRFYENFLLLSALTGGLSVGALQFSEFHPSTTSAARSAEALFTSSACSAVLAVMLAVMLNFRFEGYTKATRLDYGVAWTPLMLSLGILMRDME
ncbi:MAG: hypothetical protein Q9174_006429, partial [Haloplaca sp. 1 TL-2023]